VSKDVYMSNLIAATDTLKQFIPCFAATVTFHYDEFYIAHIIIIICCCGILIFFVEQNWTLINCMRNWQCFAKVK